MDDVTRIKVWQCVGCGRIDHPMPCVGICRDQKAEYVPASEHDARVAEFKARVEALRAVALTIANTRPRAGEAERTWLALQERARTALAARS